jgi:outer membrane biosynthesis protein TonB
MAQTNFKAGGRGKGRGRNKSEDTSQPPAAPEPVPEPTPAPEPESQPQPQPQPIPEPEPVPAPTLTSETFPSSSAPEESHEEGGTAAIEPVPYGTAPEILIWVGNDKDRAQRALAREQGAEKPRSGLSNELSEIINS